MRIITRGEFLKLTDVTLYSKYKPCVFEGFNIKHGGQNQLFNDWAYDPITPDVIAHDSSEDLFVKLEAAETLGINLEMDFEYTGRDGLFEPDDTLIAVYDEADVLKLVERLMALLPNHTLIRKE